MNKLSCILRPGREGEKEEKKEARNGSRKVEGKGGRKGKRREEGGKMERGRKEETLPDSSTSQLLNEIPMSKCL